jgi:hypothetical protein
MQSEIVQGLAEENRLDDCCMSAISEEDVLISGREADIRELPNDGMGFSIFFTPPRVMSCAYLKTHVYMLLG